MNDQPLQRVFRVQGGIFPNRSRHSINVLNNKIIVSFHRTVYIGNIDHMSYFLMKRLDVNSLDEIPEDISNYKIEVVEMYVPYWFTYLLEQYAVMQLDSKEINFPKLVDKTTPGESYQISSYWSKLLEDCCVSAYVHKLNTKQDIYSIVFSNKAPNIEKQFQEPDYEKLYNRMLQCNIKHDDIKKVSDLWGVKFSPTL